MKNMLVIKGADFSQCAVSLNRAVDYQKESYKQTDGYYDRSITVGTTTLSSVFTASDSFQSYLCPITQGRKYRINSYNFGNGLGILAWALVDTDNVILKYKTVLSGESIITDSEIDTSEYPTSAKLLICRNTSGEFPMLVLLSED